jgi:hypothetical protein
MHRRRFAPRSARTVTRFLFVAVLALIAAAGATIAVAQATKPGITLQISPASQSVTRGQQATYTVTTTSTGGFTGSVALTVSGLPNSSSAVFAPASVTLGSGGNATSTMTVSTTSSTSVSSFTLTVTGTSGKVNGSVQAGLTVNYPASGSITMSATPGSVTMAPAATAVYAIALTRTSLTNPVTFTVSGGLPSHATATYSPSSTTGNSSSLQITTLANTPEGTYTLYLVASGNDSAGTTRYAYASVQLVIATGGKPFAIAGNLTGLLAPGVSLPLDLTLTNPNNQTISISNLTVTVQSVAKVPPTRVGSCSTADYVVTQYSGPYPLAVPAHGNASLSSLVASTKFPQVTMIDTASNQDGCKGATLTLAYSGSGQGS